MSTVSSEPKPRRFSRRTLLLLSLVLVPLLCTCCFIAILLNDSATEVEPTAVVEVEDAVTEEEVTDAPVATDEPIEATEEPATKPAATDTAEPTRTSEPTETPPPTETAAPTQTPEPTPSPTSMPPTLTPGEALRATVADALGNSNRGVERLVRVEDVNGRIEVDWAINDNLTENLVQAGAQLEATNILRAVAESGYDYEFLLLRGTFPLVDQLGNVEESKVVELFFERATVDQINFDNFIHSNVYDIADSAQIHPVFVRE